MLENADLALSDLRRLYEQALGELADLRARVDAQAKVEIPNLSDLDTRFVNASGDTMSGALTVSGAGINVGSASSAAAGEVRASLGFAARVDGSSGGIFAGASSDVQLYRAAADTWRTPDSLTVDGFMRFGGDGTVGSSGDRFALADDAIQSLLLGATPYAFIFIRDNTDGHSAILHARGGTTNVYLIWEAVSGSWALADTDTKHCFYYSSGYKIKNRRGGSRTYDIWELGLG